MNSEGEVRLRKIFPKGNWTIKEMANWFHLTSSLNDREFLGKPRGYWILKDLSGQVNARDEWTIKVRLLPFETAAGKFLADFPNLMAGVTVDGLYPFNDFSCMEPGEKTGFVIVKDEANE